MQKQKIAIALSVLALIAIALTTTTYGALSTTKNVNSSGSITTSANLGVYSDSACTVPLTSIDWGTVAPGGTTTKTVYIKNIGTGVSLALSMAASSWSPSAAGQSITLAWDKPATTLAPNQSTAATFTLSVSSGITGVTSFDVQISITGTQA
jgi:hypothetical protein